MVASHAQIRDSSVFHHDTVDVVLLEQVLKPTENIPGIHRIPDCVKNFANHLAGWDSTLSDTTQQQQQRNHPMFASQPSNLSGNERNLRSNMIGPTIALWMPYSGL